MWVMIIHINEWDSIQVGLICQLGKFVILKERKAIFGYVQVLDCSELKKVFHGPATMCIAHVASD